MKIFLNIFMCMLLVSCSSKDQGSFGVHIKYKPALDTICALVKGPNIQTEWKEELVVKKADLEKEWEAIGSELISSTEKIVGQNLETGENTVHLTLCNIPSRSSPLILNMRYSLSSFTEEPVSINDKVGTLFHELLHPYIDKHLPKSAPSLEKYKNEDSRVLEHIHLLALQKAVYLSLNLNQQLLSIVEMDSSLPNGYYKKAWEIVNSSDSYYKILVAELAKP